ncbi:phage holin [Lentibacillus salicampi]|uniref:Phage holin n=1 Tax=Lentibacillus salicampi TaxID=175306 RepID=A0A4Y9AH85_9BACI|nr:phage holin [Lentibacillus salicampi]TFJ94457.1 phage holin [Lentibacillus salicampi]
MDKGTVIRTAVLAVALMNQLLVMFGKSPLPIDAEMVEQTISFILIVVTSVWAWFKNNYVTKTGKRQKTVLIENDCFKGSIKSSHKHL